MAKRFTDTDKWKDDWYISLSNDDKIVWQWLLDNCTHAGFCKRSLSLLNMMCKVSYTEEELIKKMNERVVIVGNQWFIPKFIKFQYSTLLSNKPAILSVIKEVSLNNCSQMIFELFGNDYKIIKDKDKDTVKDIDMDTEIKIIDSSLEILKTNSAIENCKQNYLNNRIAIEALAISTHQPIERIEKRLNEFCTELISKGNTTYLQNDFNQYFVNWFKKKIEQTKSDPNVFVMPTHVHR